MWHVRNQRVKWTGVLPQAIYEIVSDWLRGWREFSRPITMHSEPKPMQSRITCSNSKINEATHLYAALTWFRLSVKRFSICNHPRPHVVTAGLDGTTNVGQIQLARARPHPYLRKAVLFFLQRLSFLLFIDSEQHTVMDALSLHEIGNTNDNDKQKHQQYPAHHQFQRYFSSISFSSGRILVKGNYTTMGIAVSTVWWQVRVWYFWRDQDRAGGGRKQGRASDLSRLTSHMVRHRLGRLIISDWRRDICISESCHIRWSWLRCRDLVSGFSSCGQFRRW